MDRTETDDPAEVPGETKSPSLWEGGARAEWPGLPTPLLARVRSIDAEAGILASEPKATRSQLRDSAGFSPDFPHFSPDPSIGTLCCLLACAATLPPPTRGCKSPCGSGLSDSRLKWGGDDAGLPAATITDVQHLVGVTDSLGAAPAKHAPGRGVNHLLSWHRAEADAPGAGRPRLGGRAGAPRADRRGRPARLPAAGVGPRVLAVRATYPAPPGRSAGWSEPRF